MKCCINYHLFEKANISVFLEIGPFMLYWQPLICWASGDSCNYISSRCGTICCRLARMLPWHMDIVLGIMIKTAFYTAITLIRRWPDQ